MVSPTVGLFSEQDANDILAAVKWLRQSGLMMRGGIKPPHIPNSPTPVYVKNVDSSNAPPFACMQVVGTVEDAGQNYLLVQKPQDTSGEKGWFVFNLFEEIEAGGFGIANDGPMCRMFGVTETVKRYSPDPGEWKVKRDDVGLFLSAGPDDIEDDTGKGFIGNSTAGCLFGTLERCLKSTDSSVEVTRSDDGETVLVLNTMKLNGINGSLVKFEQCGEEFYLTHVADPFAEEIKVTKSSQGWDFADYYHGADPSDCDPDIVCEMDCSCMEDGDEAYAFYDKNTHRYIIHSTQSALYGPFVDQAIMEGGDSPGNRFRGVAGCKFEWREKTIKVPQCQGESTDQSASLQTKTVSVIMDVTNESGGVYKTPVDIEVCDYTVGTKQLVFGWYDCPDGEYD